MDKQTWCKLEKYQQLGNIGSEISRASHWQLLDHKENFQKSLQRALNLLFLSLGDKQWGNGLKEIARFYEVLASIYADQNNLNIPLSDLENFCVKFVINSKNKHNYN
ncbi:MAG: hypothetical protein APR63_02680 [Desulfuromonas sp. SDB]|nr:MAG: hypothetical protein APR63_02680 [Desulfuromonas sp. SDB]